MVLHLPHDSQRANKALGRTAQGGVDQLGRQRQERKEDAMKSAIIIRAIILTSVLAWHGISASAEAELPRGGEMAANPAQNPYEARSFQDRLEIYKGGKQIGVIHSEKPNIERWGFIDSGNHIVVRSRAGQQPVVLELFNTATGVRVDRMLLPEFRKVNKAWASGFVD